MGTPKFYRTPRSSISWDVEVLAAVLEMKEWDVNARDHAECTPLIWAAVQGHEEVVKMLLERGDVNPNRENGMCGHTPLVWAARQGHERVVKLFLDLEAVNPDQANPQSGQQVLYWAASYGQEGIVKMLLEQVHLNPNWREIESAATPFLAAVVNGNDGVVKMLLERKDVNPNLPYVPGGRTPLSYAAEMGNEGIVKMLLDRNDIRIDIRDDEDRTPLSFAYSEGRDKIARMIMEWTGTNSGIADPDSQESLVPLAGDKEESVAKTPLCEYTYISITNASEQPTSPPADIDAPEELSDWEGSVTDSVDSTAPPTGRPALLSPFPCGLPTSGIPEVKLPVIQAILRELSQSRSTSI